MSYHTWHTYGFGFCVDDIQTTPEKLLKLAALDEETLLTVEDYINELGEDVDDLTIEDFDNLEGLYCERGVSYILSRVIKEIPVVYADDYDGIPYILYCPTYPWNLTESEIGLTKEKIVEIFNKYIEILTDDVILIDFQEVENGG